MTFTNDMAVPARRRGRPPLANANERRRRALEVARFEFARRGYRAADMDDIATAAGVVKQTLYAWHGTKAGLFLACVREGATRFQGPVIDRQAPLDVALKAYAVDLAREATSDPVFGISTLLLREGRDFPEIAESAQRKRELLLEPLAHYLRDQGLEKPGSDQRARMLLAMVLDEAHRALVLCADLPDPREISQSAQLAVEIFLNGAAS